MKTKTKKHGPPLTCELALTNVRDAIGIRAICSFSDDVFALARWLCERPEFNVINQKDYISYPKPNGYRSYHPIFQLVDGPGDGLFAEIQLRTIAIDFWASLEHQLKYKHEITHEALIRSELKRCADEIASIDLSMQTIRDLIDDNFSNCSDKGARHHDKITIHKRQQQWHRHLQSWQSQMSLFRRFSGYFDMFGAQWSVDDPVSGDKELWLGCHHRKRKSVSL
ncbi:MAG: hypothetical protein V8S27_06560 [Lachnospiraceae bacterium]